MYLSNRLTFSLVCLIALFVLAAMPAMAQTIAAEWSTDRDANGTADDPGWKVTLAGLANSDVVTITYLDPAGTATAATGSQEGFADVGAAATSTTGSILAADGAVIAVQVAAGASGSQVTYQRVTFPAGGPGATLAATTLVRLPMLKKLTTPIYYVNFAGNTKTVMFDFEASGNTNGAPSAPLHVSDVTLTPAAEWQVVSVTGTNMVMVRSTHANSATSEVTIVSLGTAYAIAATAATPVNVPGNGTAQVTYDNMAPTVTIGTAPVRPVATPSDFATPDIDENTIWDEAFYLTVSIDDNSSTDSANSGPDFKMANVGVDTTKLTVVQVGEAANQDTDVNGTEYLIQIMPKSDRVTTAGEEVTITITPVDKAGNVGTPGRHKVKLAAKAAPPPPAANRAPTFASGPSISNITATVGTAISNVTLPAATDPDTGNTLTYSITPALPAGLMFNAGSRVLSGTPTAMKAQTTYTYKAMDNGSPAMSATLTFMITVNDAPFVSGNPTKPSNITRVEIPENSYLILVRDERSQAPELDFPDVPAVGGIPVRIQEWSDMPDLHDLFSRTGPSPGGALVLRKSADADDNDMTNDDGELVGKYATPSVGTVGISEIMWARDLGKANAAEQAAGQWIELHNLNDKPVWVLIYAQKADDGLISGGLLVDTAAGDDLLGNPSDMVLDAVQNIRNDGNQGSGGWNVKGKDGNSVTGEPFASMHRILPHNKPDYRNADGSRYNNRKGTKDSHWAESGADTAYLRARTAHTTPILFDYRGTPGDVNNRTSITILTPASRTGISHEVYINEVGNREDDRYSWIELKGPAGKNLRNYMISILTAVDSDTPLIQFLANDNAKIPDSGVFLILSSDPVNDDDHPIAPGRNVNRVQADHELYHWNSPVRYIVSNFELPDSGDDNGKFVLILRRPDNHEGHRANTNDGKGVAETGTKDLDKITDIAGWDDNLAKNSYPNAVSNTSLWPLHNFAAPFTNRNAFYNNTVHRRQFKTTNDDRSGVGAHENKNQDDRAAFRDIGWTGVGYRREITGGNQHGGTPGYDNGASQNRGGGIVGSVYISEIMYSDGSNGSLPQWIELRNTSMTVAADLHNWRLTITNHDTTDAEGTLWDGKASASVLLNGLKIKPNSAVLITSHSVTTRRAETHLPRADIFTLYPAHRNTFGMASASDDVINVYGFKITLHTRGNEASQHWELVDEATNFDTEASDRRGNRERFDPPRWAWPDGMNEDGNRVSVARANNPYGSKTKGFTVASGKEEAGWILSSMDNRTNEIDYVFYGDKTDISTPGQTVKSPLPVELSAFRPTLENGEVVIRWTTESELDNAGFNILRSETRDGEFKQVNAEMIQGHGTTGERHTYKWVDTTAKPNVAYYYQIEDISFAGERQTLRTNKLKGLISAKDKLTTTWGDIKEASQ